MDVGISHVPSSIVFEVAHELLPAVDENKWFIIQVGEPLSKIKISRKKSNKPGGLIGQCRVYPRGHQDDALPLLLAMA